MFSVIAMAAATVLPCQPVDGAASLWSSPATRWVVVGELHGTNEIPRAFVNLVCLAATARGPVTVALEFPVDMQPVFDAWLASDGHAGATAALFAAPWWHRRFQDGRSSTAFLAMLERLRAMHHAGRVIAVRGFDMPSDGSDHRDRNAAMADRLSTIAAGTPGLTLVLVGNLHAVVRPVTAAGRQITPAAALLPDGQRVSVNVTGAGGSSWNCRDAGCHVYDDPVERGGRSGIARDAAADRRYDATYTLGKPFSAALPAIPGVADTAAPKSIIVAPPPPRSL